MKKLIQFLPVLATIALLATGCNNDKASSSDPKVVLQEFMQRLSKKDIEGATKLATKDSKSTMDMMKKALDAEKKSDEPAAKEDDATDEFKDVVIGEAKIDGDNAVVPFSNKKNKDKIVEIPLRKEGGDWKVDFSMATLMKMGQDEMGKQGLDNMNEDGEEVNDEELKRQLESADSIMKQHMDPKKMEDMQKMIDSIKGN
jgi:hypothetical protein